MIECSSLSKNFRRYGKAPGLLGSLKSFFHRSYDLVPAVSDFSVSIGEGEIVGLLGPNGAGKTTLMKMLTGIIAPSQGQVQVLGYAPFERAKNFRRSIALVMGQKSQLWWDIPAMDSFLLLQSYYQIPHHEFRETLDSLSTMLGVSSLLTTHVRKLSLGERMKMELMACLLHKPRMLFLDEPTIGLDVVAQRAVRDFLKDYQKRQGTTILLTSHYMADVEALCSRIVLILEGRKRFDGSKNEFEKILGNEKFVSVSFSAPVSENENFFSDLSPAWNSSRTHVELRMPEAAFQERTRLLFERYPVIDFATEKLPIERVMAELLTNSRLLR